MFNFCHSFSIKYTFLSRTAQFQLLRFLYCLNSLLLSVRCKSSVSTFLAASKLYLFLYRSLFKENESQRRDNLSCCDFGILRKDDEMTCMRERERVKVWKTEVDASNTSGIQRSYNVVG